MEAMEAKTKQMTDELAAACVQMVAAKDRYNEATTVDPQDFEFPTEHVGLLVELEDFFVWARTRLEMKKDSPEPISAIEKFDRACGRDDRRDWNVPRVDDRLRQDELRRSS
jgi:hypothetical protein